ncbi:MAG TPA: hypothetical protein VEQ63_06065, partial [Bryobacteraceae bacterium]|nr:hypothetical protein [Bryobacteraceae bacterium]
MPRLLFVLPAAALLASAQSNEAPVAPTAFLRETTPLNLHNTLPPEQVQEGWISLFDGHTLGGWTPAGSAEWKV